MGTAGERYIAQALLKAEHELAELMREAVRVGDADTAHTIRDAAERLRRLRYRYVPKSKRAAGAPKLPETKPRFEVHGDELHSVFWDQASGRVDIHKVSKVAFDQTWRSLVALTGFSSGPYLIGQIIDQAQRLYSEGVRSEEVRQSVAMLANHDLIEREGADRYRVPANIAPLVRQALAPRPLAKIEKKWLK